MLPFPTATTLFTVVMFTLEKAFDAPGAARALRAHGYDCEAIKEHSDWEGLPDLEVVALARSEHRAMVTNLRDFRPLHTELTYPGGAGHSGLVFVPVTFRLIRVAGGLLVTALEANSPPTPASRTLPVAKPGSNTRMRCWRSAVDLGCGGVRPIRNSKNVRWPDQEHSGLSLHWSTLV